MRILIALVLVVATLVVAGCGSDEGSSETRTVTAAVLGTTTAAVTEGPTLERAGLDCLLEEPHGYTGL